MAISLSWELFEFLHHVVDGDRILSEQLAFDRMRQPALVVDPSLPQDA